MALDAIPQLVDKRYCTLVLLKGVETIQPFAINKQGYGTRAAWITVEDINQIRMKEKKKKSRCPGLEGDGHQQESKGRDLGVALDR